jgi:hypothetical protein
MISYGAVMRARPLSGIRPVFTRAALTFFPLIRPPKQYRNPQDECEQEWNGYPCQGLKIGVIFFRPSQREQKAGRDE